MAYRNRGPGSLAWPFMPQKSWPQTVYRSAQDDREQRRFRGRVQAGELRYDGVVALQSALLDASFAAAAPCVTGVLRRGSISTRRPRRAPAPAFGCARCRHAAGGCLACRPAGVLPPGAPCVSRVL